LSRFELASILSNYWYFRRFQTKKIHTRDLALPPTWGILQETIRGSVQHHGVTIPKASLPIVLDSSIFAIACAELSTGRC